MIIILFFLFGTHFGFTNQLKLGIGNSSNPAQSPGGEGGSYSLIAPNFDYDFMQHNNGRINLEFGGEFRQFSDEYIASNANASFFRTAIGAYTPPELMIPLALRLGIQFNQAKISANRVREEFGESNNSSEAFVSIGIEKKWAFWKIAADSTISSQRFELASFESKENLYVDNGRDLKTTLQIAYLPQDPVKLEIGGSWLKRSYDEISANPESQINTLPTDFRRPQTLIREDYWLTVVPATTLFDSETTVAFGWDVDRTNNTTNLKRHRVSQKLEFGFLKSRLKFIPTAEILWRQFPGILILPQLSSVQPRNQFDTLVFTSAGLQFPFHKRLDLFVRLFYLDCTSNNLANSYYEQGFDSTLSAEF